MNPAQRLVSVLLIIMLTAGCVSSGAPLTPDTTLTDTTTTESEMGVQLVNETTTTQTNTTATDTQTATATETATATTTATATATATPTPTPTTTMTTTQIPGTPPVNSSTSTWRENVGEVNETIYIEIEITNPNNYAIGSSFGAQVERESGTNVSLGGDHSQDLAPGETYTVTYSYTPDSGEEIVDTHTIVRSSRPSDSYSATTTTT